MLTREGWLVGIGSLILIAAGRLMGVFELFLLGTAAVLLVIASAVVAGMRRLELGVGRHLHPPQVHAGTPSRVELRMVNRASRRTPVLRLHDSVTGTRGANLFLGPLVAGDQIRAAYQLPTERRGRISIGPLDIVVTDPFGLARSSITGAGTSELIVFPKVDEISPLPLTSGSDPQSGARHANTLGQSGDDFYGLRQYVPGDDLRRVNWKVSARIDELFVRQDELPWQGRTTVLLDDRESTHTPESFELAVSAAASVLNASWRRGDHIRLMTAGGSDSDFGSSHAHLEAAMNHLAIIERSTAAGLQGAFESLQRSGADGSLIISMTSKGTDQLDRLGVLRARFGTITPIVFEQSSWESGASAEDSQNVPGSTVVVTEDRPFIAAWAQVAGASPTRTAPGRSRGPARSHSATGV